MIKRFLFSLVYPIYKLKDYPVLYRGKNFKLVNFGIFAALDAMAISIIFLYYLFLKGYIPTLKILFLWLLSGVFIWIGAKLFFFLVWWEDFIQNPNEYIFQTGFSNQGGIIGGILSAFLLSFMTKINIFIIFDGLCIGSFLGQFFGRLGCYNYGCCYGKPTDVQWSICYTNMDSKILRLYPNMKGVNIHPTQLYTAFINLLAFIGFIFFLNHIPFDGLISSIFLIFHGLSRVFLENFRFDIYKNNKRTKTTLKTAIIFILLGILLMIIEIKIFPDYFNSSSVIGNSSLKTFTELFLYYPVIILFILIAGVINFIGYGIHGKKLGVLPCISKA